MDFIEIVESVLVVLAQYLQYLYPGFVFLWVFQFIKGKNFKENEITVIKSIVISYLFVCGHKIIIFKWMNMDFYLIFISIVSAYVMTRLLNTSQVKYLLDIFQIKTSINDNILDVINELVENKKDKNKLYLKVYMDGIEIMYCGWLRIHESDNENNNIIALSSYKRYKKNDNNKKYELDMPQLPNNQVNKEWVILDGKDVTRIEVVTKLKN